MRLDGDYKENPFSPMLYLRESALSKYNGIEMVQGPYDLENDVSYTSPFQPYKVKAPPPLEYRKPLWYEVYLLANHKLAFTIDFPLSIMPLKNPHPERFKAAYKAYSMVPAFTLDQLKNFSLGNPSWSKDQWNYYLEAPKDPRYKEKALEITAKAEGKVNKAFAIINYLSKNAIYTLTPNHKVKKGEDPVAPFLFGDRRGYCVHFAHAITYMLRTLGIPARVATGYLTDLSQSKDGHILLRMSDRHAWAEVYFNKIGWVPFDVKPEHVESHAETAVDMGLLEELMALLQDSEEKPLGLEDLKEEKPQLSKETTSFFKRKVLIGGIIGSLLLLILVKQFLLRIWLLPLSPRKKLKYCYLSLILTLYDLGILKRINLVRARGETRKEFALKVREDLKLDFTQFINALNKSKYSAVSQSEEEVEKVLKAYKREWQKVPLREKLISFLNPFSLWRLVWEGIW